MANKYRCLRCRRVSLTARDDASGLCVWCRITERDRVKAEHMRRTLRLAEGGDETTLSKLARAGQSHALVSELTRDPDPEPKHDYQRDPQSGAGNCVCGMAERHRRHPHEFLASMTWDLCTCSMPRQAKCHKKDERTTA